MRILVVDDQNSIRSLIKEILRSVKITDITEASNGVVAMQKLRNSPPFDLMICDWNMPEKDGIQLITEIRADKNLFPLRILMLTSEQSRENVLRIAALKVQAYVLKPFKPDILVKAVKHCVIQPPPPCIPIETAQPAPAEPSEKPNES